MLNKKLIKQLAAGEIILRNEPKNPELVKAILKEAFPDGGFPSDTGNSEYYCRLKFRTYDWVLACRPFDKPVHLAKDFLLPEPKFKKGDYVQTGGPLFPYVEGVITFCQFDNEDGIWYYVLDGNNGTYYGEQNLFLTDQYIIGQEYEFSDDQKDWNTAILLAIVDHKDKYVAGYEDVVTGYTYIRPIPAKEITKEDLVKLLEWWQSLSDNLTADEQYHESFANLVMNSGNTLQQLSQTKES